METANTPHTLPDAFVAPPISAQVGALRDKVELLAGKVVQLEGNVAGLNARLDGDKSNWIRKISGSMKDFPEFDEVIRLGAEFRNSDQPNEQAT